MLLLSITQKSKTVVPGSLLLLCMLLFEMITYSSSSQAVQQAEQAQAQLDIQLLHAQQIGVPVSYLQTLMLQEQQIHDSTWLQLLVHPFAADLAQQQRRAYGALSQQLPGIIQSATKHLQAQARLDLQQFQRTLGQATAQGLDGLASFVQSLNQQEHALHSAHLPNDMLVVSSTAHTAIEALNLLLSISQQLRIFATNLDEIKQLSFNSTSLQTAYQLDLQQFNAASHLLDLQQLNHQLHTHYQQLQTLELQLFPALSVVKLHLFSSMVKQLAIYGVQSPTYQAQVAVQRTLLEHLQTLADKRTFLDTLDTQIAALQSPLVRSQARYLLKQFQQEVAAWAKAHPYHDSYDGRDYALDNGYLDAGQGKLLAKALTTARTDSDFSSLLQNVQNALFNFQQFERDAADTTPYNRVHASDISILNHYGYQHTQFLLVSLAEQAMRVYQQGKLVQAFLVTTGRQELPSIPGEWPVLLRQSPIIFQSGEPKDSPYWFPDTQIHYAMLYHLGGYFVHDAWWRAAFGPGTQFPHYDPIGTNAYNFDGSHGCINLSENDAAWVYAHTDWNTLVVIY